MRSNPAVGRNSNITCFKCQKKGHYSRECPDIRGNPQENGFFCGMVCQFIDEEEEAKTEVLEAEKATEIETAPWKFAGIAAAIAGENEELETGIWNFVGIAAALAEKSGDSSDDCDSMPSLLDRPAPSEDSITEVEDCHFDDEDVIEDTHFSEEVFLSDAEDPTRIVKWLLDTGASIHADTDENSVKDEKACNITVNIADGNTISPRGVGTKVLHDSVTGFPLHIKKMHVIPEFAKRILSVSKIIDDGFEVQFKKEFATITDKNRQMIKCPRDVQSGLYYFHGRRDESVHAATDFSNDPKWENVVDEVDEKTGVNITTSAKMKMLKTVDINEAHDVCGHKGEALLRKTYKKIGVQLTGTLKPCEGCGFAKAKAKAVSKTTATKATQLGERLLLDTTGPFTPTLNRYRYWIQVVDDFSRHGFCEFNKTKTGMGVCLYSNASGETSSHGNGL